MCRIRDQLGFGFSTMESHASGCLSFMRRIARWSPSCGIFLAVSNDNYRVYDDVVMDMVFLSTWVQTTKAWFPFVGNFNAGSRPIWFRFFGVTSPV